MMIGAIVGSLVDAFMEVGVFVSIMLAVITWLQARWAPSLALLFSKFHRFGPIFAATLSLPPGCSGVISIVSMYSRQIVSFGSVVAALVSTMGDSAWILLTADFELAVILKLLFFGVGCAVGLAVDLLGYDPRSRSCKDDEMATQAVGRRRILTGEHRIADFTLPGRLSPESPSKVLVLARSPQACESTGSGLSSGPPGAGNRPFSRLGIVGAVFWSAVVLGLVIKIPVEMNLLSEENFEANFGSFNTYTVVGIVGTLSAIVIGIGAARQSRYCLANTGEPDIRNLSAISVEAARIILWVAIAYGVWAIATEIVGFDVDELRLSGIGGVVLAALMGLLPSCGLEVMFAGLFTTGSISLPVLITYLLSHDGAGLIPLFATHRRSAVVATIITTITALVVGLAVQAIA